MVGSLFAYSSEYTAAEKSADSLQIFTTIFPEYDWVKQILGDNPADAQGTMLLDNGVDLHSYQPTAEDILKISTCDLFIYVGGESDEWVEDALQEATNKDMVVINLLDVLGDKVKEEELVEGMEGEEEDEEGDDEEPEYDEQSALDTKYENAVSNGSVNTLLFGDRFPFRYLVDDYGLDYFAAFVGCSAETEASFETIIFLAQKVNELSLPCIMTIEGTDHKIAETIVQNTETKDQKILTIDSMQSTTARDVQNGTTYLSLMESNLEVLKEALQ